MELSNEFEVGVPAEEAWALLTDVERIAPCLPGAQLQEIEGDEYRGIVKVKVGPISAQYKGKATFVELDEDGRRVVLTASGRDTRGQGNANATIVASLTDQGDTTHVSVVTDLMLTGKVAQFGRGVLADVSTKLMDQFVENLHESLLDGVPAGDAGAPDEPDEPDEPEESLLDGVPAGNGAAPDEPEESLLDGAPAGNAGAPETRLVDHPDPDEIDLVSHAGGPVAKRLVPLVVVVLVGLVVVGLLRRRRRRA